jgi:hypothetical protein
MQTIRSRIVLFICCLTPFLLTSCATYQQTSNQVAQNTPEQAGPPPDFASRIPQHIDVSSKTVVVDPRVHVWGAYDENGNLVKAGQASAGSDYCRDLGHPCHTRVGTFHVFSLGSPDCKSHIFPIPRGGAPMPYCMFFNNGQALHGVPEGEVGDGNYSHGCVRLHVDDAEWLRYNFVEIGTRVIVKPYS